MENKIKIWFDEGQIFIKTMLGEQKSMPLKWFPKLLNASKEEREDYCISPFGIHWENIDEDLSFEGFNSFSK
jgi:hypothetical protein